MIKTLIHEVKEYKKSSIKAPLFMVGEVLLEIMLPFLMGFIIDKGVSKHDLNTALMYGIIMLICAFGSLFCGTMSGKYAAHASAGFVKNLRKAMFKKIQAFSFKNADKYSTSGLVTRMMTDATNVQNAYQMILRMCVRAPLTLVCAICMTFYISGRLSLIFVFAIIFLGVVLGFVTYKAYFAFEATFKKYDDLNASTQENITNMRVVKAYVKEDDETKKFHKASYNLYKMFKKAEKIIVINNPAMQFTMYACMLALSFFGAKFIVAGDLLPGQLTSMFNYTMQILMSLMMLSMVFVMVTMSLASAKRIAEVINEEVDLVNPSNPDYELVDGSISFKNVSFKYFEDADFYNIENINIDIKSGETIGIIGGTGSAKSTFVQLIPRLYDVDEGAVLVGGKDVRGYDLKTLRDSVAMVLQKNVLFSGTIKENLRWGNENASDEELIKACKLAQADEFIQTFPDKYDTYIEQGGSNVSGGQKQRLCIARALLKNPKILILDDSTSAVDTHTDALIREAFATQIPNTTKLIISQRISSIESADRIIVFDDGHINGLGTHEELLKTNDIYREVYETQTKGDDLDEK